MSDLTRDIKEQVLNDLDSEYAGPNVIAFETASGVAYAQSAHCDQTKQRSFLVAQFYQGQKSELYAKVMLPDMQFHTIHALRALTFKNNETARVAKTGSVMLPIQHAPEREEVKADSKVQAEQKPERDDPDADIVQRIKARDSSAFNEMYTNYKSMVTYEAMRVMSHYLPEKYKFNISARHSDIEDIVQEAFLNVWNKIDQFSPQRSLFKTWVTGVAHNQALNAKTLQKAYNKMGGEFDGFSPEHQTVVLSQQETANNPADEIIEQEGDFWLSKRWEDVVSGLDAPSLELLKAFQDEIEAHEPNPHHDADRHAKKKTVAAHGYDRMGEILGVPSTTIRSRLFRLRQNLQSAATEEGLQTGDEYDFRPD